VAVVAEVSKNPEDWKPIIDRAMFQVAYRQLGMVALYTGIDVAAAAIDLLAKEGKGSWKWLLTGRALVWEDVPVDHAMKIHVYAFGGKERRKNTVFVRQGWWRMYFIEAGLRLFDETIAGRLLSAI
jgi:hypothetical protein